MADHAGPCKAVVRLLALYPVWISVHSQAQWLCIA